MGEDGNPKAVLAEILKHEPGSRSRGALIYKLKERINEDADFAEELVDEKGILQLLDMMGDGTGSDVGYLLEAVCCLLLYLNAMQQLATQPDIVDRIWRCATSVDESGCARIRVSKPAIQTLIVTVKHLGSLNQEDNHLLRDSSDKSDAGRQVVHRSVKRLMREKEGLNCYKSLINLLSTPETHLQTNVLGLLNILLSKAVTASKLKAKKLLFLWSQCGLIDKVKSMQSEDPTLKRLLATFDKRLGTIKVPGCWLEATKLKGKFDQEKKAYDKVSNEVFMFEQQQGRVRHAKVNITKYQETMRSISLQMGLSPNYHPAKRFSEGGGIPIPTKTQQLPSKPVNIGAIPSDAGLVDIRNKLFQVYMSAPDFMSHVEKIVGPIARPEGDGGVSNVRSKKGVKKGTGSGDLDSESDEDDDVPPSDEDEDDVLPPSDEEPPSSDDDLPPSSSEESDSDSDSDDSDDVLPPADQPPPLPADASPEQQLIHQQQQAIYENSVQQAAAAAGGGVPPPADAGAGAPAGGAPPPGVAGGAPAPPPPGTAVAPPPPTAGGAPAPPAAPGGPPPPPGTAKKRMPAPPRKAAAAAPTIEWWKGGKSAIPLRVFHWEKATVDGPMATGTIWNKVHHQIDCSFDKEDFVAKFQTKPKKTGGSKKVEEKRIEMMDAKKFQNVSIMLHKMPAIDDIKKAIDNLDSELLNRDCLEAIKAQIPNEDEEDMFVSKIDEKNAKGEDWEKPELYMKMIHDYNSGNFKKRAETWLFSQDWGEITMNFTKPLLKLRTAIDAVTACEELPYIMGVLLGFGNMMNAGSKKGNAGAFAPRTLTQLEAARDTSGKINLIQHLVHTVKKNREQAMKVVDDLKDAAVHGVKDIKYEDLDSAFGQVRDQLAKFGNQYKSVCQFSDKNGFTNDPYKAKLSSFKEAAEAKMKDLEEQYTSLKSNFESILLMWSTPKIKMKKPQPEDFFESMFQFYESFKKEADIMSQEAAAAAKKKNVGGRITAKNVDMNSLVDSTIQEDIVA